MKQAIKVSCPFLFLILSVASAIHAQEAREETTAHWGMQVDLGKTELEITLTSLFLSSVVNLRSTSYGIGIVRFSKNNIPNFAFSYSHVDIYVESDVQVPNVSFYFNEDDRIRIHGVMVTKYFEIFSIGFVSPVLAVGGGVGKFSISRERRTSSKPYWEEHFELPVGMFELMMYVDVHPIDRFSIAPMAGIRNATIVFGGALRVHF